MDKNELRKSFLNLFFNPDETICVSHNEFAYGSVCQDLIVQDKPIVLNSSNPKILPININADDITMLTINPINGSRCDQNVTAFRSFLIEADEGSLFSQKQYIDSLRLPYSCCVFSGNKSLHFAITLNENLIDINTWRYINQWILNIVSRADQQNKNPSRNIRFPGNLRKGGKTQQLIYIGNRIPQARLFGWLNQFPDKKPIIEQPRIQKTYTQIPSILNLPGYVKTWLLEGVHNLEQGKNVRWFVIASTCAERGFEKEEAIDLLQNYFTPTDTFSAREWKTTINSAFKRIKKT